MTFTKSLAVAAALLGLAGLPAAAQSRSELLERFTNHTLSVVEIREPGAPADFSMEVEFREGSVARFLAEGEDEVWAIWRATGRQICTTVAMLQGNTLVPVEDEQCLRVRFNGDQVQLNFPQSSGGVIYYVGHLTPM